MLTLETLSEQGARLSVRERLWLIWRLVRSLFGRSSGEVGEAILLSKATATNPSAAAFDLPTTEQVDDYEGKSALEWLEPMIAVAEGPEE